MSSLNQVIAEGSTNKETNLETEKIDFEKEFYQALVFGTKASNAFPEDEEDFDYCNTIPEFSHKVEDFRNRLTGLIEQFANHVGGGNDAFDLSTLHQGDPADRGQFEPIADVVDLLAENIDTYLDQAKGENNSLQNSNVTVSNKELVRRVQAGLHGVITNANILRPQLKFKVKVDNTRDPILINQTDDESANPFENHARVLGVDVDHLKGHARSGVNPFLSEIQSAYENPADWLFEVPDINDKIPDVSLLEKTPLKWVEKRHELEKLCKELKRESRIAIDLENHSFRSFQGFLCLMQISTDSCDYLIDTLALREDMNLLNEVFTDPNILKVMHGADSDVVWLQRDFGVYIVSLFDTGQAARVLQYPSAGLAFSLRHHCNVQANKAYQLADWRIRPLPEEMEKYAREDTHYLLFIFEHMRRELLAKSDSTSADTMESSNLVNDVLRRSMDIAQVTYCRPLYTPGGYKRIIKRKNLRLSVAQERVMAGIYEWRDRVAREEDESEEYVMPQRMLIRIAETVPTSTSTLESCCNPLPPIVRLQQIKLLEVIKSASSSALNPVAFAAEQAKTSNNTNSNDEGIDKRVSVNDTTKKIVHPKTPNLKSHSKLQVAGSASIGVNSSRTTFVPISDANIQDSTSTTPKPRFVDRKGSLKQEVIARATPSPVLTTDQLYDTAGWQELKSSNRKSKNVIARSAETQTLNFGSASDCRQANKRDQVNETRVAIGKEQLSNSNLGFVMQETPFATMATAMAAKVAKQKSDNMKIDATTSSMDIQDANAGTLDVTNQTAEDDFTNSPADTDALESEDIPKSMAEIYRISNRNRKRNKEKKKHKDDKDAVAVTSTLESTAYSGRKKAKNSDSSTNKSNINSNTENAGKTAGSDDAVQFMQNIGWVDGEIPEVQYGKEGGEGGESLNASGRSQGQDSRRFKGNSNSFGNKSKYRGKPNSPRRRPNGSQQHFHHHHHHHHYHHGRGGASGGGRGAPASFDYSQASAAAAGVTRPSSGRGNNSSGRGGKRNGWSSNSGSNGSSYSRAVTSSYKASNK